MVIKTDKKIIYKKINQYIDVILRNRINISTVYLFGSYKKSIFNADSDIDIAIVLDDYKGDRIDILFMLLKLRREIDLKIEPHPFKKSEFVATNPFAKEIIKTGEKIY